LYNSTSSKLSQTLEAGAARLDELVRDPAPVEVPAAPDPRPESEPPDADATRTNAVEEARFEPRMDPATMFRERKAPARLISSRRLRRDVIRPLPGRGHLHCGILWAVRSSVSWGTG
jgi:hypothetical protein